MHRHHLARFSVFGFLGILGPAVQADTAGNPRDLLADKTLSGWELITATPTALDAVCNPGADGVLAIAGKPVGYLATRASYGNYQLHFEWRWPADAGKGSNGGVLLHISSGPAGGTAWPVCFQAQLKIGRAGDLLPMASARFAEKPTTAPEAKTPQLDRGGDSSEKPPGEWNVGEVLCHGNTIEVRINGVLQNRVSQCAPASGKIGFQLEGSPFELRHVQIQADTPFQK